MPSSAWPAGPDLPKPIERIDEVDWLKGAAILSGNLERIDTTGERWLYTFALVGIASLLAGGGRTLRARIVPQLASRN